MSISSVTGQSMGIKLPSSSPAMNAVATGLDVASQMTQLMNALLMNLLRSSQQASPGMGNPTPGPAQRPGMGGLGGLGGAGGAGGLGGLGGLLQGMAELLQSLTPLLKALSSGGMGANGPASQLAGQLPGGGMGVGPAIGGLGNSPLARAGGQLGSVVGHAVGGPQGAQVGSSVGAAVGKAVDTTHMAVQKDGPTMVMGTGIGKPLTEAGARVGTAVGQAVGHAVGGAPGAQVGGALGGAVGAAAATALGATTAPAAAPTMASAMPTGMATNAVNTSAVLGNLTPQAARQWALANGGDNMTANDVKQGMQLYNIFNTGATRVS